MIDKVFLLQLQLVSTVVFTSCFLFATISSRRFLVTLILRIPRHQWLYPFIPSHCQKEQMACEKTRSKIQRFTFENLAKPGLTFEIDLLNKQRRQQPVSSSQVKTYCLWSRSSAVFLVPAIKTRSLQPLQRFLVVNIYGTRSVKPVDNSQILAYVVINQSSGAKWSQNILPIT